MWGVRGWWSGLASLFLMAACGGGAPAGPGGTGGGSGQGGSPMETPPTMAGGAEGSPSQSMGGTGGSTADASMGGPPADAQVGGRGGVSGAAGSGGSTGRGGAGGSAAGDCDVKIPSCVPYKAVSPAATAKDDQSNRQAAGYYCSKGNANPVPFVVERLCSYGEECKTDQNNKPTCVGCGPAARKKLTRTVDGKLVDDCEGCACGSFSAFSCVAAGQTGTYCGGEAWVKLFFRGHTSTMSGLGPDDVQVDVSASGKVCDKPLATTAKPPAKTSAVVRNANIQVRAGGLVEMDVTVDAEVVDNFNATHRWHIEGHVVSECR